MEFSRSTYYRKRALNVIPLIDIIFILMLFFMLTTHFATDKALHLTMAPLKSLSSLKQQRADTQILIFLEEGQNFRLAKGQSIAPLMVLPQALAPYLKASPAYTFTLIPQKGVPVQDIVTAMDYIHNAGGKNVSLEHP